MDVKIVGNRVSIDIGEVHFLENGKLTKEDENRVSTIVEKVDKFAKSIDKGAWAAVNYNSEKKESNATVYFVTTKPLKEGDITRLKKDTLMDA